MVRYAVLPLPSLGASGGQKSGTIGFLCHAVLKGPSAIAMRGSAKICGFIRRAKDGEKRGRKWQLFTRFCATLFSHSRRRSHAGRRIPSRKEITQASTGSLARPNRKRQPACTSCLYCLYCLDTTGVETMETKGTRDGAGNLHHFRPSTTCSRTELPFSTSDRVKNLYRGNVWEPSTNSSRLSWPRGAARMPGGPAGE